MVERGRTMYHDSLYLSGSYILRKIIKTHRLVYGQEKPFAVIVFEKESVARFLFDINMGDSIMQSSSIVGNWKCPIRVPIIWGSPHGSNRDGISTKSEPP